MFSSSSCVTVGAILSFLGASNALFDPSAKTNLAVYWGQGPNQQDLVHYCQQSAIDIIPIAFVHVFPAQGNGYPGDNFGNKCFGPTYNAPGYNGVNDDSRNSLQSQCPTINRDIPICQSTYRKKIILSLGGGTSTYQLTGAADGENFADFLWGAFGPQTPEWVAQGRPRPFDGSDGSAVEVDGFDFDIETAPTDQSVGYVALINRVRSYFATADKEYIITGAPQCIVPDANMGTMISQAQFDIIMVQFYNTPFCSARTYVDANGASNTFSYDQWSTFLEGTASANAKLYIGLPAAPAAAGSAQNYYLDPSEVATVTEAFFCRDNFGGVMLWEATYAENNLVNGAPYYDAVKQVLLDDAADAALSCSSGGPTSSLPAGPSSTPGSGAGSTISSPGSTSSMTVSTDGSCGVTVTCKGNPNGQCCSAYGFCGSSDAYCGLGCQPAFGICGSTNAGSSSGVAESVTTINLDTYSTTVTVLAPTTTAISTSPGVPDLSVDGSCGPPGGKSCRGDYCCSQWGYCGNGKEWCGPGCQAGYGHCW